MLHASLAVLAVLVAPTVPCRAVALQEEGGGPTVRLEDVSLTFALSVFADVEEARIDPGGQHRRGFEARFEPADCLIDVYVYSNA
jgi:hypothetical protein